MSLFAARRRRRDPWLAFARHLVATDREWFYRSTARDEAGVPREVVDRWLIEGRERGEITCHLWVSDAGVMVEVERVGAAVREGDDKGHYRYVGSKGAPPVVLSGDEVVVALRITPALLRRLVLAA